MGAVTPWWEQISMGAGLDLAPIDVSEPEEEEMLPLLTDSTMAQLWLAMDAIWGVLENLQNRRKETLAAVEIATKHGRKHQIKLHSNRLAEIDVLIPSLESAMNELRKITDDDEDG